MMTAFDKVHHELEEKWLKNQISWEDYSAGVNQVDFVEMLVKGNMKPPKE